LVQRDYPIDERGRLHGASGLAVVVVHRVQAWRRGPCRKRERKREWVRASRRRDRLRRPDKANWRSPAPFGRKGLSAHWFLQVFAASKWPGARCAGAARRTFPMNFNLPRDGAAMCIGGEPRCLHAIMRADAI
jgi:hypothetical protein